VCLWVEDFSEVYEIISLLQADGITNFSEYFDQHPEVLQKCPAAVKVLDVNQATVDLHKAGTREHLLNNIHNTFTEKSSRRQLVVEENPGITRCIHQVDLWGFLRDSGVKIILAT